jgi:alpha-glucosidase
VYQGEELGLPEVEDIEPSHRQDPMHFRSGGVDPGRDGARVPLPWSGDRPPYGFSPPGTELDPGTTLPQPAGWAALTVEAQLADPGSSLNLYRTALAFRRTDPDLGDGPLRWLPEPPGVLAFARGDRFACVVNLSPGPVALPPHERLLLTSTALDADGRLGPDVAAWLRLTPPPSPPTDHERRSQ